MTVEIQIRGEVTQDIEQIEQIGIISLIASKGNEVLGHILFSPVTTTPPSDAKGLGLAPVTVRPMCHLRVSGQDSSAKD
jgi:hypothetical protein